MPAAAPAPPRPADPLLLGVLLAIERQERERERPFDRAHRADLLIAGLADLQDGIVSRGQLRALGLTGAAIDERVGHRRLRVVHRSVYAVGHGVLSDDATRRAALLAVGPASCLSHRTLAFLLGCRAAEHDPVEVSIPSNAGCDPGPGVLVHRPRTLTDADRTEVGGWPATTIGRMLVDLAAVTRAGELSHVARQLDLTGRLSVVDVADAARRVARPRGIVLLRQVLADYDDGAPGVPFTELERLYRLAAQPAGLPLGEPQARIEGSTRRPDVLLADHAVVLELDGRRAHERLAAVADDRRRDRELAALGFLTVRMTKEDLTTHRDRTVEELHAILATRPARRESG